MAADYDHLLTELGLRRVLWIGHSIGGMIGMRLALAHPEAIESLVLIATAARLDPPQLREQAWPLWKMFRAGHREDIVDVAFQLLFAAATFKNQPELIGHYRNQVIHIQDGEGIFQAVSAVFNRTDISDQIGEIKTPTLVIAGKEDLLAAPAESEVIASRIPNARLAIIEDASHMLVVEKPREVAQMIGEFLEAKRAAGEGSGR